MLRLKAESQIEMIDQIKNKKRTFKGSELLEASKVTMELISPFIKKP